MNPVKKPKLNIMLVDDHAVLLNGLAKILNMEDNINIAATALNGAEALRIIEDLYSPGKKNKPTGNKIDLVITDIEMPEMSGTELTRNIKEKYPEIKVLVLTMYKEREIIHEIANNEAEGYILKDSESDELINAIDRIAQGSSYYCNEVLQILMEYHKEKQKIEEKTKDLSKREKEIIYYICQELTSMEIGERLFISHHTVETHRKNIMRKTGINTLVGLIKFAIENKLDSPPPAEEDHRQRSKNLKC